MVLLDAATHPLEAYVKIFGALPAHDANEDAVRGCSVSLDWGGRLRVAHSNEGRMDGNSLLAVEEYCSSFGFGDGSHDGADGLIFGENWYIWGGSRPDVGRWWIFAQVVVARSATVRFG